MQFFGLFREVVRWGGSRMRRSLKMNTRFVATRLSTDQLRAAYQVVLPSVGRSGAISSTVKADEKRKRKSETERVGT